MWVKGGDYIEETQNEKLRLLAIVLVNIIMLFALGDLVIALMGAGAMLGGKYLVADLVLPKFAFKPLSIVPSGATAVAIQGSSLDQFDKAA
jgi:hypothetical protein